MARCRIEELLRILDRAFESGEQSLLNNLASVTEAEWEALPDGAERSIRDIVHHIGMFKYMYANHAFHDGTMDYGEEPASPPAESLASPAAAILWLRRAQVYLRGSFNQLPDDVELIADRKAHWGGLVPTLQLIDTMHEHDVYHAGEINRTRGMLQRTDGWAVPPEE